MSAEQRKQVKAIRGHCATCGLPFLPSDERLPCGQGQMHSNMGYCIARLMLVLNQEQERSEQLRVQLAGCSVAALGATEDVAKQGDYGWSVAYQDVLELRLKYDQEQERAGLAEDLAAGRQELLAKAQERVKALETALRDVRRNHYAPEYGGYCWCPQLRHSAVEPHVLECLQARTAMKMEGSE